MDVRDEGAAVHMAHAHAELTGQLGVAMVTAGPGVTNCVTGIANASRANALAADRRMHVKTSRQTWDPTGHSTQKS